MATAPAESTLPLFYKSLVPLSSQLHPTHGLKARTDLGYTSTAHAIPITVDEFAMVQRHYPIIFSVGDTPTPLALVGLQEGRNLYLDDKGQWAVGPLHVPPSCAAIPFMLAKLSPEATELSLCFDDSAGHAGRRRRRPDVQRHRAVADHQAGAGFLRTVRTGGVPHPRRSWTS